MRQPSAKPMARPSGMPATEAMEVPAAIMLRASAAWRVPAMRVAITGAIAQKTACAAATKRRAAVSSSKVGAMAEHACPATKSATTPSSSGLNEKREAATMSGSDNSMTPHA